MNIQLIRYFIEIANTRNISLAARNLFVTQPTLSMALKKMESDLNTTLFVHTEVPFQLTDTGRVLYERGQLVVQQFDDLMTDINAMTHQSKKEIIKLGMTTLFSVQFMSEISDFLTANPHVSLVTQQGGSYHLQQKLVDKEIDIGVLSFPNYHANELTFEALETTTHGYHVYVVLPETNPLSKKSELTFKDLKEQRFSSLSTNFMIGRLLLDRAKVFNFNPNIVLINDDLQVLIHSLKKNQSICLLPIEYKEVGKSDGLVWVPLNDKFNFYPIAIATRKNFDRTDAMNLLAESIRKN